MGPFSLFLSTPKGASDLSRSTSAFPIAGSSWQSRGSTGVFLLQLLPADGILLAAGGYSLRKCYSVLYSFLITWILSFCLCKSKPMAQQIVPKGVSSNAKDQSLWEWAGLLLSAALSKLSFKKKNEAKITLNYIYGPGFENFFHCIQRSLCVVCWKCFSCWESLECHSFMLPLSCSSFLCFLSYNKRVLLRQPNTEESSQEWSPVLPLRWVQFCPCLKASSSSPRTSPCSTHFNSSKAQAPWAVHRGKDAEAFPSRWLRSRKVFTRALFLCENLVSPGMMNEAKLLFVPPKKAGSGWSKECHRCPPLCSCCWADRSRMTRL